MKSGTKPWFAGTKRSKTLTQNSYTHKWSSLCFVRSTVWECAKRSTCEHCAHANPAQLKSSLLISRADLLCNAHVYNPLALGATQPDLSWFLLGVLCAFGPLPSLCWKPYFYTRSIAKTGFWYSKAEEWFFFHHKMGRGRWYGKPKGKT